MKIHQVTALRAAADPRLPLSSFRLFDTSYAEEAEQVLSDELNKLRILRIADHSEFRVRMNGVHLGGTLIGFNCFDAHTLVDPGRIDDAFILSFGHQVPSMLDVDSQSLVTSSSAAVVLSPSCRLRIDRPAGSGMILVRASQKTLAERFRTLTGNRLREPLRFSRAVDLSSEPGATALRLVRFVTSELEAIGSNNIDVAHRSALEDLLLSAMLTLPNNHSDLLARDYRGQIAPRLVRVAEEFMVARSGEPISISDLLAVCGCSRSVLFEAFRRYRSNSPMQFLTDTRMERARRQLMSGSSQSVASTAHNCGFRHLGRFSVAYRKRFGESPSETVKKRAGSTEEL